MSDFVLEVSCEDVAYELNDDDVQPLVRNTIDKLSAYCKNPKIVLEDPDYIDAYQLRLIHFIQQEMQDEGQSLFDYSYCRLVRIDAISVIFKFFGLRDAG